MTEKTKTLKNKFYREYFTVFGIGIAFSFLYLAYRLLVNG